MNGFFYEYYYNGTGVAPVDYNNDGLDDFYIGGAKNQTLLFFDVDNDGLGNFKVITAQKSGLYVKGDVKDAAVIHIGTKEKNRKVLLIAKNNNFLQLMKINK